MEFSSWMVYNLLKKMQRVCIVDTNETDDKTDLLHSMPDTI